MIHELVALATLVLVGKLFEEVASRKGYPAVVGWALAGIVLGPALLDVAEPTPELLFFAGIGVYIFFFLTGVEEVDVEGILSSVNLGWIAAPVAATLLHVVLSVPLGLLAGLSYEESLAVAVIASIPASSVVAKTLSGLGLLKDKRGIAVFSYTLTGELLGLLLASTLLELSGGPLTPRALAYQFGMILLYFAAAGWASVYVVPRLVEAVRLYMVSPGALVGIILGILLLLVGLGELAGVHGVVGSLLLGLVLSDILLEEKAAGALDAIKRIGDGLFIPLFFAAIGLRFSPVGPIEPLPAAAVFTALLPLRVAVHYAVARAAGLPALDVAAVMTARGAVDLAVLGPFLDSRLVGETTYTVTVAVGIAMLIAYPLLARRLSGRGGGEPGKVPLLPLLARHLLGMMRVSDVMEQPLEVGADATVEDARKLLEERGVDVAVVRTPGGLGLLYMRDLERAGPGEPAASYARRPRVTASPGDPLHRVLEMEALEREGAVLVIDERGEPVGVVEPRTVLRRILSAGGEK